MTKIVFYGASVTQQRNGYVNHFAKLSKAKVLKFGFGGMHLNDAGICFVDKAVQTSPDIYYYGGSLKLCTKGSRFSYFYALLMSKVFAAKHRLKVIFGINS